MFRTTTQDMARAIKVIQGILALSIAFLFGYLLAPTTVSIKVYGNQRTSSDISQQPTAVRNSSTTGNVTRKVPALHQVPLNNTIDKLGYLDIDKRMLDIDELYKRLVIVTAISDNHFVEAKGIIATAQQTMPDKKIIVYDLGLNEVTINSIKSFCNVEYRPFPFSDYPKHVSQLMVYAWKPLIINITLNEFGAIYWGDAGNRFLKSLKHLLPYAVRHHGYMTYFHSFDPKVQSVIKHQYYFTHPGMFEYFGINRTQYYLEDNAAPHAAANRQLFINSTTLQSKMVRPLTNCALNFECISPGDAAYGSHRFDASALALLMYKNMKYEWTPEKNDNAMINAVLTNSRDNGQKYTPKVCGGS